jgi:hypothetical protein
LGFVSGGDLVASRCESERNAWVTGFAICKPLVAVGGRGDGAIGFTLPRSNGFAPGNDLSSFELLLIAALPFGEGSFWFATLPRRRVALLTAGVLEVAIVAIGSAWRPASDQV